MNNDNNKKDNNNNDNKPPINFLNTPILMYIPRKKGKGQQPIFFIFYQIFLIKTESHPNTIFAMFLVLQDRIQSISRVILFSEAKIKIDKENYLELARIRKLWLGFKTLWFVFPPSLEQTSSSTTLKSMSGPWSSAS